MKTRTAGLLGTIVLILISSQSYADGALKRTTDVYGQGVGGPLYSPDGTTLIRTKNGISVALSMPTPMPGTYNYPPANPYQPVAAMPGTPEAFTGWIFFFNDPANCAIPHACSPPPPGTPAPNDFTTGSGGVYNFAGHAVSGGGSLNMVGHISVGESNFGGPATLQNPYGAEIHVAIAPHGVVIPGLLPGQFNTPIGNPSYWWVSLFLAP